MSKFGMDGEILASRQTVAKKMSYGEALCDATTIAMRRSKDVIILGEGITDSGAVFGSTAGLLAEFGPKRVIETPLSEAAMTGICTGAALAGLRPILVHQRIDFTLLGMDQLVNHAAKWSYMYAGKLRVPFVMRCIVGKGWGQAAQHSQSLQALFAHIPGLKVVMPATPRDAKGLLLASLEDNNPVVFIEARPLYNLSEEVPSEYFREELGRAIVRRPGRDISVIGVSHLMPEILQAAELLRGEVDMEVIDLRSVSPLDTASLVASVQKTGHALVVDTAWKSFGISAEISARLHEQCFGVLKKPVQRLALPDVSTPCSPALEKAYYPNSMQICTQVRELLSPSRGRLISHSSPNAV